MCGGEKYGESERRTIPNSSIVLNSSLATFNLSGTYLRAFERGSGPFVGIKCSTPCLTSLLLLKFGVQMPGNSSNISSNSFGGVWRGNLIPKMFSGAVVVRALMTVRPSGLTRRRRFRSIRRSFAAKKSAPRIGLHTFATQICGCRIFLPLCQYKGNVDQKQVCLFRRDLGADLKVVVFCPLPRLDKPSRRRLSHIERCGRTICH